MMKNPQYILSSLGYEIVGNYVVSHQGSVLWSSSVRLSFLSDGVIDFQVRADILCYLILNIFTPSSWAIALQGSRTLYLGFR
jgi:hypothetical protein